MTKKKTKKETEPYRGCNNPKAGNRPPMKGKPQPDRYNTRRIRIPSLAKERARYGTVLELVPNELSAKNKKLEGTPDDPRLAGKKSRRIRKNIWIRPVKSRKGKKVKA